MKRQLSLVLALVMILGSFSSVFATDVPVEKTVTELAGEFLKTNGVLEGADGDLMLDANLKRRDAVVLLSRLYGEEAEAKVFPSEDLTFTDITDHNYNGYIAWSVEKGIIEGHYSHTFGFNEEITAQDLATVLLRVLGHEVDNAIGYPKAIETAKGLGLLKDLEVENKTVVSRGMMAVMTFNTLGAEVKGTGKTLADKLGIEMPAAEKLEVVSVRTENLKEVVVEYNNAKLTAAQEKEIVNAKNYTVSHSTVREVVLEGNVAILSLETALVQDRSYEVKVRNIVKHDVTVKAVDNTSPSIEKVEVLGTYGIKVVMSEPIKNAQEKQFLLNGKSVAMELSNFGREITLRPYHKERFEVGEQKLTVLPLEDYAGFKSAEVTKEIEIKEYAELPEVVEVEATNNTVIVTYSLDVFPKSVDGKNLSWSQDRGRTKQAADSAELLSGNKVEYTFKTREIPARTGVTLEVKDVENYSRKVMKTSTHDLQVGLDYTRPEIMRHFVATKPGTVNNIVEMELVFNKDMDAATLAEVNRLINLPASQKVISGRTDGMTLADRDYVGLYGTDRDKFGELVRDDLVADSVNNVRFKVENGKEILNTIIVEFNAGVIGSGKSYDLRVEGFRDATVLRNNMVREDYIRFREGHRSGEFYIKNVAHKAVNTNELEFEITFTDPVDRRLAEEGANYRFTLDNNEMRDLRDLGGKATVSADGYKVTLEVGRKVLNSEVVSLRILDTVKNIDGIILDRPISYSMTNRLLQHLVVTPDVYQAGATHNLGKNEYDVVIPGNAPVTIRTDMEITINVYGANISQLVIDAPHAHVVVKGNVVNGNIVHTNVGRITIDNIGDNSLVIADTATVTDILVNTTKTVRIYGNIEDVKIIAPADKAVTVLLATDKNTKQVEVKIKKGTAVTVGFENGKIVTEETDVVVGNEEITEVKETRAKVNNVPATQAEVNVVVATSGAVTLDLEINESKIAFAGKDLAELVKNINDAKIGVTATGNLNIKADVAGDTTIKVIYAGETVSNTGKAEVKGVDQIVKVTFGKLPVGIKKDMTVTFNGTQLGSVKSIEGKVVEVEMTGHVAKGIAINSVTFTQGTTTTIIIPVATGVVVK